MRHAGPPRCRTGERGTSQISAAPVSAASRLTQYRLRVLPVLSYTAQLRPAPRDLGRLERVALERLLQMPHNAVPTAVLHALPRLGVPAPPPASCICLAALTRAATSSAVRERMQQELDVAREAHLPLAAYAQRRPVPPGWDNEAIVDIWSRALGGSPAMPNARRIIQDASTSSSRGLQARLVEDAWSAASAAPVDEAIFPRITRLLITAGGSSPTSSKLRYEV